MTPDNEPEKLDGHSLDIAEERRKELLRLFPEVRTEGGKVAECFRTIQATSTATLSHAVRRASTSTRPRT